MTGAFCCVNLDVDIFARLNKIKNFRLDLVQKAIRLLLDNPDLSSREVARKIGVSEFTIRYWKKQSFWEVERQKLINDRAEAMGIKDEQHRAEYRESLKTQQQHLKILRELIHQNTTRSLRISTQVYAMASMMDDSLEACSMATKAGAHTQAKAATEGIKSIMAINDHLYQIHVLIEYFEGLEDGE